MSVNTNETEVTVHGEIFLTTFLHVQPMTYGTNNNKTTAKTKLKKKHA